MSQKGSNLRTQEFAAAVICMFENVGAQDPAKRVLQEKATAYCNQIKVSADGWKLCMQALIEHAAGRIEIKFWCLDTLRDHIKSKYESSSDLDKSALRGAIFSFLKECCKSIVQPTGA